MNDIELTTRENVRHEWNDETNEVTKTWTETKPIYRVACGQEYATEYWDEPRLRVEHTNKCKACAVLTGRSKATVMKQEDVAKLFTRGIDGRRSGGGEKNWKGTRDSNYESQDGILFHYGTIEGIRLLDGKVVANTQCWSAGFAHCSLRGGDYRLPLTTIRGEVGSVSALRAIVVLDSTEDGTLFRYESKYFLFGWDERAPFLVVLPKDDEIDDVPLKARFKQSAVTNFERRLVRPRILGTNHSAGEIAQTTTRGTIVRGTIQHQPEFREPDHASLKLGDQWHAVYKNRAVESIRVPRRGGRGGMHLPSKAETGIFHGVRTGSIITRSAKQQKWTDDRARQLSMLAHFIRLLNDGKPRSAIRFAQEHHLTMVLPDEVV